METGETIFRERKDKWKDRNKEGERIREFDFKIAKNAKKYMSVSARWGKEGAVGRLLMFQVAGQHQL